MRTRVAAVVLVLGGSLAGCGPGGNVVALDAPAPEPTASASSGEPGKPGEGGKGGEGGKAVGRSGIAVPPPLSPETLQRMRKRSVFWIKLVDPAVERPQFSAARMTQLLVRGHRGEAPVEMSLVRMIRGDHLFRPDKGTDPKLVAKWRRDFERKRNVLAWAMLYEDDTWPILGPPRDRTNEPCCYTADSAAFYSATTGKLVQVGSM